MEEKNIGKKPCKIRWETPALLIINKAEILAAPGGFGLDIQRLVIPKS